VLLLAAVTDVRRTRQLKSSQLGLPIVAVFLGDISALNALAFSYAGSNDFAAVASSLVSPTVALVLAVLPGLSSPEEDAVDEIVNEQSPRSEAAIELPVVNGS